MFIPTNQIKLHYQLCAIINGITYDKKLVNLAILLDDSTISQYRMDDLPTNLHVIYTLKCAQHQREQTKGVILRFDEDLCGGLAKL